MNRRRCALWAAVALLTPLTAAAGASVLRHAETSNPADQGIMVASQGVIPLANSTAAENADHWMKFETDPCGTLQRVRNGRSTLTRSALDDDLDGPDDDDPSDQGRALIGRWLSEHSEIAVIDDGVDKTCDGDDDSPFDDEEFTDVPALHPRVPSWLAQAPRIA